jgi:hypothetical protein
MSTILHPVQHHHTRLYAAAAAALAVGLLSVLMTAVFSRSGADSVVTPPPPAGAFGHVYRVPCFAGHPSMSIELVRSGCRF